MLSDDERDQMRRWLDNWRRIGPILEAERWQRIVALTDDEAWVEAQGLFQLWEPGMTGDAGEGLELQQDVFMRWLRRRDP